MLGDSFTFSASHNVARVMLSRCRGTMSGHGMPAGQGVTSTRNYAKRYHYLRRQAFLDLQNGTKTFDDLILIWYHFGD